MEPIRHVRPAQPLRFPESQPEWDLGQSIRHLHLCAILHEILRSVVGPEGSVGCDQFVYFDAANPRRCLAPDGFVKLGVALEMFETWRVWEKGAPDLAIEILSPSDTREPLSFPEKLERYASAGVRELIGFDVDAPVGERLSAWEKLAHANADVARANADADRARAATDEALAEVARLRAELARR